MRYYFINQEMKDTCFDVEVTNGCFIFKIEGTEKKLYFKKLAGKFYGSFDQKSWVKLANLGVNETLVSHSEVYKVFRGFKPSGLNAGGAGALITQMPGKVVKILKKGRSRGNFKIYQYKRGTSFRSWLSYGRNRRELRMWITQFYIFF
jgi:hypothetical protein